MEDYHREKAHRARESKGAGRDEEDLRGKLEEGWKTCCRHVGMYVYGYSAGKNSIQNLFLQRELVVKLC